MPRAPAEIAAPALRPAGTAAGPRIGARKPETPAAVSPAPAAIAFSAFAAIEESALPILPKLYAAKAD